MAIEGRVVVLAGGLSPERDVSIRSGRRLAEAMRECGLDVAVHDVDASLLTGLREDPPVCVIPILHGAAGEDGALRDVLESLRLPYVGSRADACRLAFDKSVTKALVRAAGLRTAEAVALPHSTFRELGAGALLDALVDRLGLPLVVKPTRGGSALGTSVVREAADLPSAMVSGFAYGDTVLVEQFVAGTEVAISVIEHEVGGSVVAQALPAVEICPDDDFYDYTARYTAGATEFFVPARLSEDVAASAAKTALAAHETLGLRDWSRTDLIIDTDGVAWFLETNVAPGMTETSLLPQSVVASGLDLGHIATDLTARAISRG